MSFINVGTAKAVIYAKTSVKFSQYFILFLFPRLGQDSEWGKARNLSVRIACFLTNIRNGRLPKRNLPNSHSRTDIILPDSSL